MATDGCSGADAPLAPDEGPLRRYRGVLQIEIELDGVFRSRKAFREAVEAMWQTDGYFVAGANLGLDVEEHWEELTVSDVDPPEEDDDDDD